MKKILSLILAVILMLTPLYVQVSASDSNVNYDDLVAPCYDNIDMIGACISEGVLGFAVCGSTFLSFETDKTFILSCFLQRTDENSAWQDYKSTSETFSGKGSYSIEKNWFAPAGYDYRVVTLLVVKNSSGVIVETATKASGVLYK
ncbi:MAG: hypothetical protein IJZ35_03240 [Clostridia bacterium]|nr:hypothetical protein [Clostridia bacterium]